MCCASPCVVASPACCCIPRVLLHPLFVFFNPRVLLHPRVLCLFLGPPLRLFSLISLLLHPPILCLPMCCASQCVVVSPCIVASPVVVSPCVVASPSVVFVSCASSASVPRNIVYICAVLILTRSSELKIASNAKGCAGDTSYYSPARYTAVKCEILSVQQEYE